MRYNRIFAQGGMFEKLLYRSFFVVNCPNDTIVSAQKISDSQDFVCTYLGF